MRRFNIFLLLISLVILCPTKSRAQMQSVINTSTKRTITASNSISQVESIAISPTKIISAGNFTQNTQPAAAVFCLTDNDSNNNPNYPNCGANTVICQ